MRQGKIVDSWVRGTPVTTTAVGAEGMHFPAQVRCAVPDASLLTRRMWCGARITWRCSASCAADFYSKWIIVHSSH